MSFNPELWVKRNSTYLTPSSDTGVLLPEDQYIGFGVLFGDAGYGIRDNSGTIQWKNSGGSWQNIGSSTGVVETIVAGTGIDVDNTDPANPEVSLNSATQASLGLADSAVQPADIANFETTTQLNARDTANRNRDNHTGTQLASTISDFQTAVSANTDVAANTAARHDAVTLTGQNYLSLSGQQITANQINLTSHVTGILPIANGGTGSDTKNFVDLTTAQTIAGIKTFSSTLVAPGLTNAGELNLSATGGNPIILSTNGSERMRISPGGNFGIGTNPTGGTSLDIARAWIADGQAVSRITTSSNVDGGGDVTALQINANKTGSGFLNTIVTGLDVSVRRENDTLAVFRTTDHSVLGAIDVMRIMGSGNVGIGTSLAIGRTTPRADSTLTLESSANGFSQVINRFSNTTGDWTGIAFRVSNDTTPDGRSKAGVAFERTASSGRGSLHFLTNNAANSNNATLDDARMTITAAGNVGIGIAPTAVLHLKAGTATANTAPLKLTAGTNLTTPEAGVFEFSNSETGLTFTAVSTRRQVVLDTATQTLTNKRINARQSSTASASSVTPDKASFDEYYFTAQAAGFTVNNATSPSVGDTFSIYLTDNATPRTIGFGGHYVALDGLALPTTTTASKTMEIIIKYVTTTKAVVSYVEEA